MTRVHSMLDETPGVEQLKNFLLGAQPRIILDIIQCASVVYIPSKGTTSGAFVMTNNVVFGNRYPVSKTKLSSGGVL